MTPYLLELLDVKKYFNNCIKAVDGITLNVSKGETLGLVGESGCGKSTLANLIVRLEQPTSGHIMLSGVDITNLTEQELRPLRYKVQMIFQDPYSSLNPRMKVASIVTEPLAVRGNCPSNELRDRAVSLLTKVGMATDHLERYPHEFSGGQRQRLSLARALITNPELLILDEPTSALDVSVQAQALDLLQELQSSMALTYLFISHNLAVVKYIASKVAVMYLGYIVEYGKTADVFKHPLHPYTQALISAVPKIKESEPAFFSNKLYSELPSPANMPRGCRYHPRCPFAKRRCAEVEPLLAGRGEHKAACMEAE